MPKPAYVEEQFEDIAQQTQSATLGMWTFLATEVLFFGALFLAYTTYRHFYFADFGDPVYRGARLPVYDERCPHSPAPHGNAVGFEPSQGILIFSSFARGFQLSNDRT